MPTQQCKKDVVGKHKTPYMLRVGAVDFTPEAMMQDSLEMALEAKAQGCAHVRSSKGTMAAAALCQM